MNHLPMELLHMVAVQLCKRSLKSLSLVNRKFRALCAPYLFYTLEVSFSLAGLYRLEKASHSQLAQYVRTVCYQAPELIDPRQ
jgi:hypothetical protein